MGEEKSIWDEYVKINGEWKKPVEATFVSDHEIIYIQDNVIYLKKKEEEWK